MKSDEIDKVKEAAIKKLDRIIDKIRNIEGITEEETKHTLETARATRRSLIERANKALDTRYEMLKVRSSTSRGDHGVDSGYEKEIALLISGVKKNA